MDRTREEGGKRKGRDKRETERSDRGVEKEGWREFSGDTELSGVREAWRR